MRSCVISCQSLVPTSCPVSCFSSSREWITRKGIGILFYHTGGYLSADVILKFDVQKGPFSFAAGARMDLLIFDLDGTLIDSKKDLVNAVNSTRAHMGMPALADDTVASYIGNGAPMLIRRAVADI